jgi:acyl-CoA synthetase (AMP-forming)/AMP-acid ligase II
MRLYRRGPHTLRELFAGTAAVAGRTFLVYEQERWTYGEHLSVVARLARWMRDDMGLRRGDRVAIAMRNYPEWSPAFWAALVAGCVAVPLNAWWTADPLSWAVGDSGAALLVADGERVDLLAGRDLPPVVRVRGHGAAPAGARDWADVVAGLDPDPTHAGSTLPDVDVLPDDDATIVYTSGTTGRPKGSVSTHRNHCTNALNVLLQAWATAWPVHGGPPAPPAAQPGTC